MQHASRAVRRRQHHRLTADDRWRVFRRRISDVEAANRQPAALAPQYDLPRAELVRTLVPCSTSNTGTTAQPRPPAPRQSPTSCAARRSPRTSCPPASRLRSRSSNNRHASLALRHNSPQTVNRSMILADRESEMPAAARRKPARLICRLATTGGTMAAMPYASLADFLEELSERGELARHRRRRSNARDRRGHAPRRRRWRPRAALRSRPRPADGRRHQPARHRSPRLPRRRRRVARRASHRESRRLIEQNTPRNWFDRLKQSADDSGAGKFRPRSVKNGPCQQVVRLGRDIDLGSFPLLKQWPAETVDFNHRRPIDFRRSREPRAQRRALAAGGARRQPPGRDRRRPLRVCSPLGRARRGWRKNAAGRRLGG